MKSFVASLITFFVMATAASTALAMSTVTVSWNPPSSADAEYITGYRLRWSTSDTAEGATLTDAGNVLSAQLSGLPDSQKVWIWVQAYDVVGQDSPWSLPAVKPALPATIGGLKVTRVELVR